MRKIFMLLVACVAMMCVSCSKDDDATVNPDGKRLVSKIRCVDAGNELTYNETTFQYDKNGNIEKITDKGRDVDYNNNQDDEWVDIFTFSRSGNKITSTTDLTHIDNDAGTTHSEGVYMAVCTLNEKGCITQYDKQRIDKESSERHVCKYSYDNDGQLIKQVYENGDTYEYTWTNGNLVSKRNLGNRYITPYTETYTYTNEENKANIDFGTFNFESTGYADYLELFGYLGKTNKNLLKKANGREYDYEFDGDYVSTVKKYRVYNGERELIETYYISYK